MSDHIKFFPLSHALIVKKSSIANKEVIVTTIYVLICSYVTIEVNIERNASFSHCIAYYIFSRLYNTLLYYYCKQWGTIIELKTVNRYITERRRNKRVCILKTNFFDLIYIILLKIQQSFIFVFFELFSTLITQRKKMTLLM